MTGSVDNTSSAQASEAELTVKAIHEGSVDALVVQGPEGPQIMVLENADQPYRMLVERMSDGALTLGLDDRILYANKRLGDLKGEPSESFVGQSFASLFEGPVPPTEDATAEARLVCKGASIPVAVWVSTIHIGRITAKLVTITDLSVQHRVEAVASAERFARSILEQSTEPVIVLGLDGRITHTSLVAEGLALNPPVGRTFSQAFLSDSGTSGDGGLLNFSYAEFDRIIARRPFHGVEVTLGRDNLQDRSFLLSAGPLLDAEKQAIGAVVTLTDITARKRAEEQQKILVAELNHRVKNILAVVQAIASQTVRTSSSLQGFNAAFAGRIRALSIAHDILTRTRWIGIGLFELLEGVLSPYRGLNQPRVELRGPPIMLPARAIVPLSMAVHELATNAAKYGALSGSQGVISVDWLFRARNLEQVELNWRECGGPEVRAGCMSGFGTTLIRRVIASDLDGSVDFEFAATGLQAVMKFPLSTTTGLNDLAGAASQ